MEQCVNEPPGWCDREALKKIKDHMKGDKHFLISEKIRYELYEKWNVYTEEQKKQWVGKQLEHLRKAAYAGHPEAQFNLACFYEYGVMVNDVFYFHNEDKMIYWMKKAAASLYPDAVENMALLYESNPVIRDWERAKVYYELYDKLTIQKMGAYRKDFLRKYSLLKNR